MLIEDNNQLCLKKTKQRRKGHIVIEDDWEYFKQFYNDFTILIDSVFVFKYDRMKLNDSIKAKV